MVKQQDLLNLLLDHREMVGSTPIIRRIVPHHLGYIPDDCLPIYNRMLLSENSTIQYWACQALLAYAPTDDAVDVAIDLIDQSVPSDAALQHPGAIYMLVRRFAVNYFWDTKAWRSWAQQRQSQR